MRIRYYHSKKRVKQQISVNDKELSKGLSLSEIKQVENEETREQLLEQRRIEFNKKRGHKIKSLIAIRLLRCEINSDNYKKKFERRVQCITTPCNCK